MAALLVALSVMSIMMSVVMPVWKHAAQREKEEELVFRGKQYVHAISLFQRKFANAYPPNFDVLVEQRFLRKKFKDPITNDDFVPLGAGQAPAGVGQPPPGAAAQGSQGAGGGPPGAAAPNAPPPGGGRRAPAGCGDDNGTAAWRSRTRLDQPEPDGQLDSGRHRRRTWRRRRHDGRRERRHQQEQGSINSPLQRPQPLQRVGVHLHAADAAARGRPGKRSAGPADATRAARAAAAGPTKSLQSGWAARA